MPAFFVLLIDHDPQCNSSNNSINCFSQFTDTEASGCRLIMHRPIGANNAWECDTQATDKEDHCQQCVWQQFSEPVAHLTPSKATSVSASYIFCSWTLQQVDHVGKTSVRTELTTHRFASRLYWALSSTVADTVIPHLCLLRKLLLQRKNQRKPVTEPPMTGICCFASTTTSCTCRCTVCHW